MLISPHYVFGEFQKAAAFWKFSLFILELPLLLPPSLFLSTFVWSLCSVHRSLAKTDWVFLNKEGEGSLWVISCFFGGSWANALRLFGKGDFGTVGFWDLFSRKGDTSFVGVVFSFVCCLVAESLSNWSNFLITLAIDFAGCEVEVLKPFETVGGVSKNKTKLTNIAVLKLQESLSFYIHIPEIYKKNKEVHYITSYYIQGGKFSCIDRRTQVTIKYI